jgi:trimeric autotransporter adhesin
MSTKTLRKHISLVAVSALGAGLLSIVSMPASNAATFGTISVGTIPAARAGSAITVPITINVTPASGSETITVAAKAVSAPTSGGLSNAPSLFTSTAAGTNASGGAANVLFFGTAAGQVLGTPVYGATSAGANKTDDTSYIGAFVTGTTTAGNIAAATAGGVPATAVETVPTGTTATTVTTYLTIRPDLPGTYSFIVSVTDSAARNSFAAGDTSTLFTVTTAGAPATAALTAIGGSTSTNTSGSYGALYRLTFKDAAGVATTLVGDEAFTITPTGANISKATVSNGAFASVAPSAATAVSFGAADLVNGNGFMNVDATAAATNVVLTGAGAGTLPSTVTTTASFTSAAGAATGGSIALTFAGAASTNNSVTTGWVGTTRVIPTTATSSTIELTRAAADNTAIYYGYITIQDNNGLITGVANTGQFLTYDRAFSMAAAANFTTVSVTHAAPSTVGMTAYTATPDRSASGISGTVVSAASTLSSSSGSVAVLSPSASLRLAAAGSVTFSVRVRDQFRNPVANTGVAVTFAGRNAAKASATVVTGATGIAEYTFTDSATTGATDTISFSASGAATTATVSYGANTAGAVLVATPSTNSVTATTLAGADAYPKAWSEISAADGAEAGAVTVTALVTDADKNVMAGMPVAWTVTGTGCAITSTSATSYTGANGQATASLYAWLQGTCVVTATSGGQSDTANSYWRQSAEVRTIEAKVDGNAITATVKDRFGNPVRAIAVTATRTSGVGFFGSASSATANTDDNGQVIFAVSGGAAKATVSLADETFQQSDAIKGGIDGVSTASTNKFTATTVGTTLTAETGIGASFDAAGVNSVTVDVTADDAAASAASAAADAAAEATDAANAATDAANAAAEAADAATAAAQDAADAVAALATSVEAMVNALKRQITSLTNLVIKIQKKVRA